MLFLATAQPIDYAQRRGYYLRQAEVEAAVSC